MLDVYDVFCFQTAGHPCNPNWGRYRNWSGLCLRGKLHRQDHRSAGLCIPPGKRSVPDGWIRPRLIFGAGRPQPTGLPRNTDHLYCRMHLLRHRHSRIPWPLMKPKSDSWSIRLFMRFSSRLRTLYVLLPQLWTPVSPQRYWLWAAPRPGKRALRIGVAPSWKRSAAWGIREANDDGGCGLPVEVAYRWPERKRNPERQRSC